MPIRVAEKKKKREREKRKKKKKKCRIANKSWTIFENYSWQNADSTAINNFAVLVDARKKYHPPGTSKGFFFFFSSLLETSPDSRPGVNGSLFFFCTLSLSRARAHFRVIGLTFRCPILERCAQTLRSLPSIISRILINRSRWFK